MKKRKMKKSEHLVVRITPVQLKMIINHIRNEKGVTISDFVRSSINKQLFNQTQL